MVNGIELKTSKASSNHDEMVSALYNNHLERDVSSKVAEEEAPMFLITAAIMNKCYFILNAPRIRV